MDIYFYNTLSGKKERFVPVHKRWFRKTVVGMYNCGPTVYSKNHIGHARAYVFADLLRRTLAHAGYVVHQVINITDVGHLTSDADEGEDKIEKSAKATGLSAKEITERYTNTFFEDLRRLNIDTATITFPRATDHIPEQIRIIQDLEKRGFTYQTSDGIYYDTSKFAGYGKLGHVHIAGLKEGARVEKNTEKKHATDFALWKFSNPNEQRQQEWDSPWGVGFPGWHIECSAMSKKYLGQPFDIHTGGIDHIQIHHNNEIAQSEGAYQKPQARFWMHSGHILIHGEKIAKSAGNSVYLEDLEQKGISPLSYRYWLLTSHYSTLVNFTEDAVRSSDVALNKLIEKYIDVQPGAIHKQYASKIMERIHDNLDTAGAIAIIWQMTKDQQVSESDALATLLEADTILGLAIAQTITQRKTRTVPSDVIPPEVETLVAAREKARVERDFKTADAFREQIQAAGFDVYDSSTGPRVKKK